MALADKESAYKAGDTGVAGWIPGLGNLLEDKCVLIRSSCLKTPLSEEPDI